MQKSNVFLISNKQWKLKFKGIYNRIKIMQYVGITTYVQDLYTENCKTVLREI